MRKYHNSNSFAMTFYWGSSSPFSSMCNGLCTVATHDSSQNLRMMLKHKLNRAKAIIYLYSAGSD